MPARRRPWGLLFEVDISTSAAAGADPVAAARAAEALGFDFVSANDHPAAHDLRDETWTMLAWIAPATSRIRVATRVLGSPTATRRWWPRSPRPSSGSRVGGSSLGWGWRLGRGVPRLRARVRSPRDKIDGLEEAVRVIRGLWTEPGFQLRRPPLPDRGGRAGAQAGPSHPPLAGNLRPPRPGYHRAAGRRVDPVAGACPTRPGGGHA